MDNRLTAPRLPDDVCLVERVTALLQQAGHPNAIGWFNELTQAKSDELILANPVLQRFLINDIFRLKLGAHPSPTHQARFILNDSTELELWLRGFEQVVAPLVSEYEL